MIVFLRYLAAPITALIVNVPLGWYYVVETATRRMNT